MFADGTVNRKIHVADTYLEPLLSFISSFILFDKIPYIYLVYFLLYVSGFILVARVFSVLSIVIVADTIFFTGFMMLKSNRPLVYITMPPLVLGSKLKFLFMFFWNMLHYLPLAQVFSSEFWEIFKNTFFNRTPLVPVCEFRGQKQKYIIVKASNQISLLFCCLFVC